MLFDTHAHYDDPAFDGERDALLASLPQAGVGAVLNPGCNLASSREAVALAHRFPHVYAAVGIHPSDADSCTAEALDQLAQMARDPKVKAIGEIGLDHYWEDYPDRSVQRQALRAQLALAQSLDLPVILHDREAHRDCLDTVREFPGVRGVFHCYSGSLEDAKTLLSLGWYLSFTGSITFKNAKRAPEVLSWLPADRFMIETDAPYMLPYPREKGERRNDSAKVGRVADRIAEIRGTTRAAIEAQTWQNALDFFRISPFDLHSTAKD